MKAAAVAAAVALAPLSPLGALSAAHAAAPAATHGIDFDYFDDAYTDLGANSVFETVTLERFKYILRDKPGNFAFLIGDPADANTQATIGHINDVAKDLGISKIYNFTPKIDGGKWNLWNWADLESVVGGNGLAYWKAEGTGANTAALSTSYLNQDTTPQFVRNEAGVVDAPYLFVHNKDRTVDVGGTPTADHIVSSLADRKTAADLDTPAEVTAFRDQVRGVLDDVPAGQYAVNSAFTYWKDEGNRRHAAGYNEGAEPGRYGGTEIITDADNVDGWRIQPITYPEWIALLKKPGDIPFLFGGTWCHNTRAIIKEVNRLAQENGVKKVYNFDYSLFSTSNGGTNYDHSRSSGTTITTGTGDATRLLYPSHLYGQTINTYLSNAIAQYGKVDQVGQSPNYYHPDGDVTKPVENAVRIQVGHFLTYNKDHKDAAGAPAPVVDQALRQNDDGGNTEHMTEWWFVKNRELPSTDHTGRGSINVTAGQANNGLANQRAFAKEAIDDIEQVFRGFTTDLPSTTTVAGIGPSVDKGATPTLQVSLDAAGYAPYSSSQGTGSATPGTLIAKPRGWVRLLNGTTEIERKRVTRAGTTSFTLPAQNTPGPQSYSVQYLGRGELIQPSTQQVSFAVAPTTTTLAGAASAAAGQSTQFTATLTPATATGSVTLTGLPGAAITGTINAGSATLTVPGTVPSGTYQVKAVYAGNDDNAASESATQAFQVVANPSTTTLTGPESTTYGAGGTYTATVTNGATGTVRLLGLPEAIDATISSGTASFTLPAGLPVGAYQVHAQYLGDSQFGSSESAPRSLSVAKAATTTTVAGPASLALGAGGTVTATVPGATGPVTLSGLPGGNRTAQLASGVAQFTVPASTPAGSYSLTASYAGNGSYLASESTAFSLAVAKGTASPASTATNQAYGRAGSVTVTVPGTAGIVPTGTVRVLEGATVLGTAALAGGQATIALPRTATVKRHVLKVEYLGDANYLASTGAGSFTVTKGTAKAPTFKVKGALRSSKAGSATVTVGTAAGLAKPSGKVKLVLKSGRTTKTVNARLGARGTATVKLPKLAKGKWTVQVTYLGSTTYAAGKAKAVRLTVKK